MGWISRNVAMAVFYYGKGGEVSDSGESQGESKKWEVKDPYSLKTLKVSFANQRYFGQDCLADHGASQTGKPLGSGIQHGTRRL